MKHYQSKIVVIIAASLVALGLTSCSSSNSSPQAANQNPTADQTSTAAARSNTGISALVPAAIQKRGYVVIATDPTFAPLEFTSPGSNKLKGMEIQLGDDLAAVLGLNVKWVTVSFDSIIPGLQAGRYDLSLSGFWVLPERLKVVSMITYFESGSQYLVKSGSTITINQRSDLCGLTVAEQTGSTEIQMDQAQSTQCQATGKKPITVLSYPSENEALLAVTTGRANTIGLGSEVAQYVTKNSSGNLALAGDVFSANPGGVAFPKNSPLLNAYMAAFQALKSDGKLAALFKSYGISASQADLKLNR